MASVTLYTLIMPSFRPAVVYSSVCRVRRLWLLGMTINREVEVALELSMKPGQLDEVATCSDRSRSQYFWERFSHDASGI